MLGVYNVWKKVLKALRALRALKGAEGVELETKAFSFCFMSYDSPT